jgi:hypothetical protein
MLFGNLFSRRSRDSVPAKTAEVRAPATKLDASALDECVGGRAATEGIGCYMQSDQQRTYG